MIRAAEQTLWYIPTCALCLAALRRSSWLRRTAARAALLRPPGGRLSPWDPLREALLALLEVLRGRDAALELALGA